MQNYALLFQNKMYNNNIKFNKNSLVFEEENFYENI